MYLNSAAVGWSQLVEAEAPSVTINLLSKTLKMAHCSFFGALVNVNKLGCPPSLGWELYFPDCYLENGFKSVASVSSHFNDSAFICSTPSHEINKMHWSLWVEIRGMWILLQGTANWKLCPLKEPDHRQSMSRAGCRRMWAPWAGASFGAPSTKIIFYTYKWEKSRPTRRWVRINVLCYIVD